MTTFRLRWLLATVLFALVAPLPVPPPADAASCPTAPAPPAGFTDRAAIPAAHVGNVDCASALGIVEGFADGSYGPTRLVRRDQMASYVARTIDAAVGARPLPPASASTDRFADIGGNRHAEAIRRLYAAGIVTGRTPTSYAPGEVVRRDQVATFVLRAAAWIAGADPARVESDRRAFYDVAPSNVHYRRINGAAWLGLVEGRADGAFRPAEGTRRDQMASVVVRALDPPGIPDAVGVRAAWVHLFDDTLKSRASIGRMVRELEAAGATSIIAQVARRHDAYYRSDVLPRTRDPRLEQGLDVLAELTAAAHARGLEVHAWISVAPTWHNVYATLPAPAGWVYTEHGPHAPQAQRWVTRTVDGRWSDYLDPGLPQVRAHVAAVVRELAARYPLDGIHLDYVRYESNAHGYHPAALARFRAETGVTGTPSPSDAAWSAWRRAQTRAVMVQAREAIAATGRDVDLSAAVITWGPGPTGTAHEHFRATRAYTQALQDWPTWVAHRIVDQVMPMTYFRAHDPAQARWFDQWLAFQGRLARDARSLVVPGVAGYLNTPAATVRQVHTATRAADGAVVYSYQQPTLDFSRDLWARLAITRWGDP